MMHLKKITGLLLLLFVSAGLIGCGTETYYEPKHIPAEESSDEDEVQAKSKKKSSKRKTKSRKKKKKDKDEDKDKVEEEEVVDPAAAEAAQKAALAQQGKAFHAMECMGCHGRGPIEDDNRVNNQDLASLTAKLSGGHRGSNPNAAEIEQLATAVEVLVAP